MPTAKDIEGLVSLAANPLNPFNPQARVPLGPTELDGFLNLLFASPDGTTFPVRAEAVEGEPWFRASDICAALGLSNTARALAGIPKGFLTNITSSNVGATAGFEAPSGGRAPIFISEPGMWLLVSKSRKPQAKAFQLWMAETVLPSLRKTGSYTLRSADAPNLGPSTEEAIAQAVSRANVILPVEAPRALSIASILSAMDEAGRVARRCKLKGAARLQFVLELAGKANDIDLRGLAEQAIAKTSPEAPAVAVEAPALHPPLRVSLENHVTATELGQALQPPRSAQAVNQALESMGLQERYFPGTPTKGHEWRLTPLGAQLGGRVFPVDKAHNQGVTEQIRWAATQILPQLGTSLKESA